MPPDKKAPTGTSATIRRLIASRSNASSSVTASPVLQVMGFPSPCSAIVLALQYLKVVGLLSGERMVRIVPGSSLYVFVYIDHGAGM